MDTKLKATITAKKIGGYVFVISFLLLGSIMIAWWVLSNQVASARVETASLVNYLAPGLEQLTTATTSESQYITSQNISNRTIKQQDIAVGGVAKDNLSPALVKWIEDQQREGLLPFDLDIDKLLQQLQDLLGLPISEITSLEILDGAIGLLDLDSTVNNALSLIGTVDDGAVTSLKIADGAVSLSDLGGSVTNVLDLVGTVGDSTITSLSIVDGAISAADIGSGEITSTLLAPGSVLGAALATGSVDAAAISDGSIGANDIADGAVGTLELAVNSIIENRLADNAVTSDKIADGEVGLGDLDATVNTALSLIGTVNDNAVSSIKIVDGAIGLSDLSSTITDALSLIGTIDDNTITSAKIVDGTISAVDIAAGIINGGLLANGAVDVNKLADNAVTGIKILDGTIGALDLATGIIDSSLIADGTITFADIANGAIDTLQLADGAVTSAKIFDGTIAGTDIAASAVGVTQLAGSAVQTTKLSTASNKKTVSVQIGDISIVLGDTERPIFVAPTNGTITKVTFTNGASITAGLNKGTLSIERKTAATATVASVDLSVVSLSAFTAQSPTLGSGTTFSTGDIYSFKWDAGLIGVALTGMLATIEYTASE